MDDLVGGFMEKFERKEGRKEGRRGLVRVLM